MALQPGVGLGLLYNTPPGLSIPCSPSPFVYSHLSQARGHVIQPSHFWSSSSSCCIQLSVQHLFWKCGVLHSFYVTKPSYSLAFNEPDNVIIIINIQGWAIWPVPSPELQLFSPSFLWSPNCSLSLWAVKV